MDAAKIAKLQEATEQARQDTELKERILKDSKERLEAAKALLQSMDVEDQQRIPISDTQYPELLGLHQLAKDEYETAKSDTRRICATWKNSRAARVAD